MRLRRYRIGTKTDYTIFGVWRVRFEMWLRRRGII